VLHYSSYCSVKTRLSVQNFIFCKFCKKIYRLLKKAMELIATWLQIIYFLMLSELQFDTQKGSVKSEALLYQSLLVIFRLYKIWEKCSLRWGS